VFAHRSPIEGKDQFSGREKAPLIHASALVASAAYALDTVLASRLNPFEFSELAAGGIGAYLQLIALLIFLGAVAIMQRHMGVPLNASRTETPPDLCSSGPFRYSRNPIYLAFVAPLAALGYVSPLAAAISIAAYIVAMNTLVIRGEEKALHVQFGSAFDAYCSKTPRWIGVPMLRRF
jgi:protein-S-isoprenylcysteine O-methyltransferase Ste14